MKPIMLLKDSESRAQNSSNFEPQKLCMNTYISTKKALMYPNTCWKFVSLQLGLKTLTIPGFLALKSQFLPVSIPLLGGEKNNDQGMYAPLPTKLLTHTRTRTHTPLHPSFSERFQAILFGVDAVKAKQTWGGRASIIDCSSACYPQTYWLAEKESLFVPANQVDEKQI